MLPYIRDTRAPRVLPPPHSCDCHFHVFGDPSNYPPAEKRTYDPPDATVEQLLKMHAALGIGRGVMVQPAVYGTDNRLLADALADRPNYRGVAAVDDSVSDTELDRLDDAGVRGARFNLGGTPDTAAFSRSIARIRELGWHAKIGGSGDDFVKHAAWLRSLDGPFVLDHLAGAEGARGLEQPVVALALELLREGWWILLSNGDRRSSGTAPWDDMVPIAQAYAAAAPDRILWASDWPHLLYAKPEVPNDADLVELLYRYLPDKAALKKILVDNPARLYGFGS
jgi:2-pyrone-4,6-dicarboxylate lactonase